MTNEEMSFPYLFVIPAKAGIYKLILIKTGRDSPVKPGNDKELKRGMTNKEVKLGMTNKRMSFPLLSVIFWVGGRVVKCTRL